MPDPIRFDVSNPQTPQAGAVVYISDDTDKWGRLDITLTNPSTDNSDLKLDPGGVLQIYLEMLTPDDITNITLPANSAWAGGPDTTNRHLELHPKQTITIPSQNSISIELHNVLGHAPHQGKFRFYDASLGIKNAVVQGFVQRPPGDDAGQWGLACNLVSRVDYQSRGDTIYVTAAGPTEVENYLVLELYHQAGGTLPSAGTPQLSVSFLTGNDELALCSEDQLKKIAASIANQEPVGRWNTPAVDAQGQDTVWTVSPVDGGGDLFPADGVLTLRFDGIVTDLPAGGTAAIFIQYSGLSGYDDGYLMVLLNKTTPVPYVNYFRARAKGEIVGADATIDFLPLTLEWDVFAADSCLLQSDDESEAKPVAVSDSKPLAARPFQVYTLQPQTGSETLAGTDVRFSVTPPVASITSGPPQFTINWECTGSSADNHCVLDARSANQAEETLDFPLSLKTQKYGRELLTTGPQTYSLGAKSLLSLTRQGGGPNDGSIETSLTLSATISWSCSNGDHCVLYANGAKIADGLPLSEQMPAQPGTTYTIECIGAGSTPATTVVAGSSADPTGRFSMFLGENAIVDWFIENVQHYEVFAAGPQDGMVAQGLGASDGEQSYPLGTKYSLSFTSDRVFFELLLSA